MSDLLGVRPRIWFVGETRLRRDELRDFLAWNQTPNWSTVAPSDGEELGEFGGRLCYQALDGNDVAQADRKNPNITRVREGNAVYLANLEAQMHGSVLEHTFTNWIISASRVVSHELARHRVGTSFSQESGRYVRTKGAFDIYQPDIISNNSEAAAIWAEGLNYLEHLRDRLVTAVDLHNPDLPFGVKKALTSAIRRLAPEGRQTALLWGANLRALRFIIPERTAPGAEIEIRWVFAQIAERVIEHYPNIFAQDLIREPQPDGPDWYRFKYRKV